MQIHLFADEFISLIVSTASADIRERLIDSVEQPNKRFFLDCAH